MTESEKTSAPTLYDQLVSAVTSADSLAKIFIEKAKSPTDQTEERRFRTGIRISLLTLFLTPLLSAGVVQYQLSREHSFLESQRKIALEEARRNERIRQQTKIANLVIATMQLRSDIAGSDVFNSIQVRFITRGAMQHEASFEEALRKRYELDKELRSAVAELQAYLTTAQLYFGPDVRRKLAEFIILTGKFPYVKVPRFDEIVSSIEDLMKKKGLTEDAAIEQIQKQLMSSVTKDKWGDLGMAIVRSMTQEVAVELGIIPKPSNG